MCGEYNDLTRRTSSDKVSYDKAFKTTKKYEGYNQQLALMVSKHFDRKLKGRTSKHAETRIKIMSNQIKFFIRYNDLFFILCYWCFQ